MTFVYALSFLAKMWNLGCALFIMSASPVLFAYKILFFFHLNECAVWVPKITQSYLQPNGSGY